MLENKSSRIINYVVDIIIISILTTIVNLLTHNRFNTYFYLLIYLMYYSVLESIFGQTIGKMITKTKVVDYNNKKPNFFRVFFRTILRINPLDTISYLFGTSSQGTHDLLSKTKLIDKLTYPKPLEF